MRCWHSNQWLNSSSQCWSMNCIYIYITHCIHCCNFIENSSSAKLLKKLLVLFIFFLLWFAYFIFIFILEFENFLNAIKFKLKGFNYENKILTSVDEYYIEYRITFLKYIFWFNCAFSYSKYFLIFHVKSYTS